MILHWNLNLRIGPRQRFWERCGSEGWDLRGIRFFCNCCQNGILADEINAICDWIQWRREVTSAWNKWGQTVTRFWIEGSCVYQVSSYHTIPETRRLPHPGTQHFWACSRWLLDKHIIGVTSFVFLPTLWSGPRFIKQVRHWRPF